MKAYLAGFVTVAILVGLFYMGWVQYEDFLTQGRRPPEATQIFNEMQEEGVPNVKFKDIQGNTHELKDYKDKVVIINFWASWCDPCVDEFPSLLKLVDHYEGDVKIFALSADYTMKELTDFLKIFEASDNEHFIVGWDKDKKIANRFGTQILPESYIIGKNNELLRKVTGIEKWYGQGPLRYFDSLVEKEVQ